ncbi:hypothetical protein BO82DRAFT_401410 [Aspergillus uvarum CBS 121591]|uniref:PKS/mFAS DH domain-containing protein n=1 Tax=Aspergillus uvarum CBS 121591 TaxID=1448315 RepID=A0A319CAB5_9EURO|nr:hypothetical protein BO82DRAFT_401410 [Aspergillus uvarum CBS 121591]PYH82415.1 hypothetical protein BO82DRAFT_401410 [Aspergillus uvarum CBS 121591]
MTAGHLHIRGVPINLTEVIPRATVLTDLPPYHWTHDERLWSETRMAHDWRLRETRHHELLGSRCLESTDLEPAWRNLLQLDNILWLLDHRITGEVVFPCAAYAAMAGESVRQVVLHATPNIVESLKNVRQLLIPEGRLLLQELSHDVPIFDYIMGALSSWWLANDGRERSYLSPEQWDHALLEAGFTGTDVVRLDNEAPYHINANMLSKPHHHGQVRGEY